jgi:hypothetical protein
MSRIRRACTSVGAGWASSSVAGTSPGDRRGSVPTGDPLALGSSAPIASRGRVSPGLSGYRRDAPETARSAAARRWAGLCPSLPASSVRREEHHLHRRRGRRVTRPVPRNHLRFRRLPRGPSVPAVCRGTVRSRVTDRPRRSVTVRDRLSAAGAARPDAVRGHRRTRPSDASRRRSPSRSARSDSSEPPLAPNPCASARPSRTAVSRGCLPLAPPSIVSTQQRELAG